MKSTFDTIKEYNKKKYSGMRIGGKHSWNYNNAEWEEEKIEPDKWKISMTSIKKRKVDAPANSGVPTGTEYHWYVIGHQVVRKINENEYETKLTGNKYKLGHKRPYWRQPSYMYKEQPSLKQQTIMKLNEELQEVRNK